MTPVNIAKSVHKRLLNLRDQTGQQFERLLVRYGLERLLYRLDRAGYGDTFILKGAMLFTVWQDVPGRTTRDLDLLGLGDATHERLRQIFVAASKGNLAEDGLQFDEKTITTEDIREEEEYQGIRVRMTAFLDRARIPIQVDIGFGDAVIPEAEKATYPVLFNFPAPSVKIYHPATVIAEKFNAMIILGILNSRMKDIYDVYMILTGMDVKDEDLMNAIQSTFHRRKVELPSELPPIFSEEFLAGGHKEGEWQVFLKRSHISIHNLSLREVLTDLRHRLWPIVCQINDRCGTKQ